MNIYSVKNTGVAGNIWKFAILLITNKRTYMPFFSIFLLTLPNATAQTVGFVTFIGQLCGFIFEVPSGYLADKVGHKSALVMGKFALALSTLFIVLATTPLFYIITAVLMAFGQAMLSGTVSAFMQETLDDIGKTSLYSSIIGRLSSVGFAIPVILIIILPILAELSYQWAFSVVLFFDLVGVIFAISMKKPRMKKKVDEFDLKIKGNIFKEYIQIGWLPYVLFSSLFFMVLFSATAGFKNPFQEEIGFSISMLGILWAFSRVGVSSLLLLNGWFKKYFNLKQIILVQGLGFIITLIGVALVSNKWIISTLFIFGTALMWGFASVKDHLMLEYIENSNLKSTFLSINAFFKKILTAIASLLMGYLVFNYSYQDGFLVFGLIGIFVFVLGMIFLKNKKPE